MTARKNFLIPVRCLGIILLVLFMTGCATEPGVLNFGVPQHAMWPPLGGGDEPRYSYAGQLTGEENFRDPTENPRQRTAFSDFWHWLAGIFNEEAVPVVLQRPQSGVVDEANGRIYVTDVSRQAVYVFDQVEGRLDVWEFAAGAKRFVAPAGIALGEEGEVFVADAELGVVVRLNRKGESLGAIGKDQLRRPVGLAFDAATRQIYVADSYAHDIKVFNPEGMLLRTLGRRGDQPGEFNYPTYIAFAKGELYVTDTMNTRVQVLNPETGQSKQVIGEQGLKVGNLVRPKGVAVDGEGNIYVVESYYDHLLMYNKNGEFLMPIGGTGQGLGEFYLPSGVWIDSHNRVFVADTFNGRVELFQFLGGGKKGE